MSNASEAEFYEALGIGKQITTGIGVRAIVEDGKWVAEIVIGIVMPPSGSFIDILTPQLVQPIQLWHSKDSWNDHLDAMQDGRKQLVDCLHALFNSREHGAQK